MTELNKIEAEQLKASFGLGKVDDGIPELALDKNYYYVLDEDNVVIDCGKIYSFTHENTLFQRIASKINNDMEEKRKLA